MELSEFFEELKNEIAFGIDAYQETHLSQFVRVYTEKLKYIGEIEDFEMCFYYDQKAGIRVDGYWADSGESGDGILSLFIADYDTRSTLDTLTNTEIQKIFRRIIKFLDASRLGTLVQNPNIDITSPEYALSTMIKQKFQSFFKINLYLLSERKLSQRVKKLELEEIDGKQIHKHIWDVSRLYDLIVDPRERIEIDCFEMFNHGIPCLHVDCGAEEYDSYLAVISGKDLACLYERYDSRLLEQNVRTFLQARGKVNKGIRTTIMTEPSMFFAYNNGITATAQKIEVKQDATGMVISHMTDLQIVNGGQTTASFFHTRRKDKAPLDQIFVQMKLSVIDPKRSEEIVPKISEYANTQNKVNAADFFSNAPFHVRMQDISRRLTAPARPGAARGTKWFYERVRGQYVEAQSKLTAAETRRFQAEFPKQQVFSKEDLAKYENVWDEPPHIVSQGRQKNFAAYAGRIGKEWEKDNALFNEGYYKQAIARAILFRETEKIVSSRRWYEKGGSIRSYIVYYSLACLGELARRRNSVIPFMTVWDQQDVPEFLRDAIAKSADYINDHIKNPTDNFPRDSEWFKRQICWTTLQNVIERLETQQTGTFWSALVSQSEYDAWVRQCRQGQGVDNGIQAQTQVVNIPAAEWQAIFTEMQSRRLLSSKEADILRVATQIPNRIPTDRQCQVLLDIRRKAIDEGIVAEN